MSGWKGPGKTDEDLRQSLLSFIADFANWDVSSDPTFLRVGRGLVKAAHPEETPLVVDPFAGGGSIPLEALRLGCEAFASDLNPVACLILKTMLEDIPRHGPGLAEELRRVGKEIKEAAEKELAEFYPTDPDGSKPIAYLWARTVRCESPKCGAEIPLVRSFWLCKKASRRRALRPVIHHRGTESTEKTRKEMENSSLCPPCLCGEIDFEIFEPESEGDVPAGTVSRAKATCLCCGTVLPPERVRAQLREQRGGADVIFHHRGTESTEKTKKNSSDSSLCPPCLCGAKRVGGARLLAVVTLKPGEQGRHYRLPTESDYQAVWKAQKRLKAILDEWERGGKKGLCPVPDEPVPSERGHRAVGAPSIYGMRKWGDLYTARQKLAFDALRRVITCFEGEAHIREFAGLALSRFADISNALCQWQTTKTQVRHLFTRHDLPMLWDFAEPSFAGGQAGDYAVTFETMVSVAERLLPMTKVGIVQQGDACQSPLPDESALVWFTDPPYYDAVAYGDLSDFFYVWLKRVLPLHPLFHHGFREEDKNCLTPKGPELTVSTIEDEKAQPKYTRS
jgi:adenine-specific DNA methylase